MGNNLNKLIHTIPISVNHLMLITQLIHHATERWKLNGLSVDR